jgi:hypothetical protein
MALRWVLTLFSLLDIASASAKRGLTYSNSSVANEFLAYPSITWGYDWGYPANGLSQQLEFIPMLWGDPTNNPSYISEWRAAVQSAATNGSHHLLAFNEPDINGLSPQEAASAWMNFMQPYKQQGFKLGAPAVTNGGSPTGLTWLEQFLGNCTQCTVDFVPFHWYANAEQVDYFTQYVQQVYAVGGNRPIWITEFEGEGTDDDEHSFINTILPWLDSLSYVERYSYFGVFSGLLVDNSGQISALGKAYGNISNVNSTIPTSLVGSNFFD